MNIVSITGSNIHILIILW